MQIILLEKVVNLGNLGEIVKVKDGYARNFLIPSGQARRATNVAIKEFEEKRVELEKAAHEKLVVAQAQGEKLSGTTVKITQKAGVAALIGDLKPSIEMTEEFTRRRTKTLELVNAVTGFKCFAPQGAFYVFPDVSYYYGKSNGTETIKNAADFSMYLLNTAHVSSVMGDAFGEPNCVRFSFANNMQNIEKAWTIPIKNWQLLLNQFLIIFEARCNI